MSVGKGEGGVSCKLIGLFYLQIENFSLQVLHTKLQFSLCGMHRLDIRLLLSTMNAVIGYLVILIQFSLHLASLSL